MYIFGCVSIWSSSRISQLFCHGDKTHFISGKMRASKIYFGSGFQAFFSPQLAGFEALVEGEPAKMVGSHFGYHMIPESPEKWCSKSHWAEGTL